MTVELVKEYRFEAAHSLPRVRPGHRCQRVHGHSYRFEVCLVGEVDEESGWLIDFYDIDAAVEPVIARLDHYYLNEVEGLANPTSEVIAKWIFDRLKPQLPPLAAVTLWETHDARCTYRGA